MKNPDSKIQKILKIPKQSWRILISGIQKKLKNPKNPKNY